MGQGSAATPIFSLGKRSCFLAWIYSNGSSAVLSVFLLAGVQADPDDSPTENCPLICEWAALLVWPILFPSWDLPGVHVPLCPDIFSLGISGSSPGPQGSPHLPPRPAVKLQRDVKYQSPLAAFSPVLPFALVSFHTVKSGLPWGCQFYGQIKEKQIHLNGHWAGNGILQCGKEKPRLSFRHVALHAPGLWQNQGI